MKVAIDGGVMSTSAGRGMGVYAQYLVDALKSLPKKEGLEVDVVDANSTDLSEYNLVHYPSFDFFFHTLPPRFKVPTVVTVHDTIPLIYPNHYPPGIKGSINLFLQKRSLKNAAAVITDSQTSKKDIIRLLNIAPGKISPIYLGPTKSTVKTSKAQASQVLKKYGINFPFVMYIGDVNWNKNVPGLAAACELAKVHLVISGKRAVSEDYDKRHIENAPLRLLQEKFGNSKFVHRLGFVEDGEVEVLMQASELLVQPSFYEGFGLTPLDAMTLGVPTACARTQTLVEIYSGATVFFDPSSVQDMANVIRSTIKDKKIRKNLVAEGEKLAQKFSWEKTAQETLAVYRNILS